MVSEEVRKDEAHDSSLGYRLDGDQWRRKRIKAGIENNDFVNAFYKFGLDDWV